MTECKSCTMEVDRVHPDGQCHNCHVFDVPSPIVFVKTGDFLMSQSVHYNAIETVSCKTCGTKEFIVGKGNYNTVIKCKACGWERTIHEG